MTAPAQPRRRKDHGVGVRLAQLREQRKLSQTDVARRLGCAPSFVSQVESGQRDLRMSTILRYCDAIGARIHIGLDERAHTDTSPERT